MFLIGDIGGTHARLSLLGTSGRVVKKDEFHSGMYPSLDAILRAFLGGIAPKPKVRAAAFGVAGPVVNGRCVATNLPWIIDARVIARKHRIKTVTLLNDLVALSLGALEVPRRKLHLLNDAGHPKKRGANIAVIAAGTGLGEAMLIWDGAGFVPNATEGGHSDFAPRSDLEVELLQFLRGRFGRVSWERVLSGSGLGNLYDFFRGAKGVDESRGERDLHRERRRSQRRDLPAWPVPAGARLRRARSSSSRRSTAPRPGTSPSKRSRSGACSSAATSPPA